jgi:2-oxoglutarate ferredoxin oxidoreductase subunit alpha
MVNIRQAKVDKIADHIPLQKIDSGPEKGKVLVIGWGSTYGAIKSACIATAGKGPCGEPCAYPLPAPFPKKSW